MPDQIAPRLSVRLSQIRLEAEGIASYELLPCDAAALPSFEAGAHINVYLPGNIVRSYSLVNDPLERHRYVIAVQHELEGRGGSRWMHTVVRVGDKLEISVPANNFSLCEDAGMSVFICGGIGVTPVVSMICRLEHLGRPWRLFYAARSHAHAAFLDPLTRVSGNAARLETCFGTAPEQRLDISGIVRESPAHTHFYCCGPAGMLDCFIEACSAVPPEYVHYERFSAVSGTPALRDGFEVVLQRSDQRINIAPGTTILDALLEHGIPVQYACSAGFCGTCRTAVLDGVPDHRDDYLTTEEKARNDVVMVCCSGSLSKRLVLDL